MTGLTHSRGAKPTGRLGAAPRAPVSLTVEAAGHLGEIRWYGPRVSGSRGRRVTREQTCSCRGKRCEEDRTSLPERENQLQSDPN